MLTTLTYLRAHEWANMGQGAPEVGPIPGSAERPTHIDYPLDALEYGKPSFSYPLHSIIRF